MKVGVTEDITIISEAKIIQDFVKYAADQK
jgi:hypothetical protein